MSFGQNIQFLRKMRNKMTQEELAEKLGVSRQTVSKWELDVMYPEMDKVIEICKLFSCSMDELIRNDMNVSDEAYSDIRMEYVEPFRYIRYAVVSTEPEDDALDHVKKWAKMLKIQNPEIIGWDFPVLSQEQINVFNMHINRIPHKEDKKMISCFEKEYFVNGTSYMDVYIAVDEIES